MVKFSSCIKKGNNKGTGFLCLPKKKTHLFNFGLRVKVKLFNKISFFAKIVNYSGKGIYVPKHIMEKYDLFDKDVNLEINRINGFYSKMSPDGVIYIPKEIIKEQKIEQNDIILIKGLENNKAIRRKYTQVKLQHRKKISPEYICVFDKSYYGKELVFQIEKKTGGSRNLKAFPILKKVLKGMHYAFVDDCFLIIFKGNKIPIIINTKFQYSDLSFYLGAYLADGTKKGNSWAICASTFEQAKFYWKMHNLLIKDSIKPEFTISYTNINNTNRNKIKKKLTKLWKNKAGIKPHKFRIRDSTGNFHPHRNHYGSLIIREHRQILLDFYNALLNSLIEKILLSKDKKLATDFICGVMEGDGCAPSKKRGFVAISANKKEFGILKNILQIIEINYSAVKEGENKYKISIGALEILRNFQYLGHKIFSLYPKRRRNLFERLRRVGAVRYLIEDRQPASWVKTWFLDNGLIDKNYNFTKKGLKLSNALKNLYTN